MLSQLSQPSFKAQVAETSTYLTARLGLLAEWFPDILQPGVRGRGLILGLGFKDASIPARVVEMARERGLFVLTAGKDAVRLVPSLNVGKEEVEFAVEVLESILVELSKV